MGAVATSSTRKILTVDRGDAGVRVTPVDERTTVATVGVRELFEPLEAHRPRAM